MITGVLTPDEAKEGNDERIVKKMWKLLDETDIVISHNGCFTAGHKILMRDLTWKNIEDVKMGDEIIAFDEYVENPSKFNKKRKYKTAKIIQTRPIIKECSLIELENGEKITVSNDHPWLVQRSDKHWRYTETKNLLKYKKGILNKVLDVWETENNYHAGYIAGFFDADGCLVLKEKRRGSGNDKDLGFQVTFTQKSKENIEKLKISLDYFNFQYSILPYDRKHREIMCIAIKGGFSEKIRFLGIAQTSKNRKIEDKKLEAFNLYNYKDIKIKSIIPVGKREVIGLETSSKTYIVNGYPVHNSRFDIPKLKTRFLKHSLGLPSPYQSIDTLETAKREFRLSSNKLDYICEFTKLDRKIDTGGIALWDQAEQGDKEALDKMNEYCQNDVKILEEMYLKLRPYMRNHPNLALYMESDYEVCPNCGGEHLKWGYLYRTRVNTYECAKCNDCGAYMRSRQSFLDKDRKSLILT